MKRKKKENDDFSFRPFNQLKSSIDSRPKIRNESHAASVAPTSDADIFKQAMKDVREIKEFRDIPVGSKSVKSIRRHEHPDREAVKTLEGITKGKLPMKLSDTQEYVEWSNPELDCSRFIPKQLHEGTFAVQDLLDLHGYTVDEAESKVSEFLKKALISSLRCVRIIHGRGLKSQHGPVLKNALTGWLTGKFRKNIMAFVTARQCDGGLGAIYILLKAQKRKQRNQ
jgi:DNA-nicking Smr family endonuclease